MGSISAAIESVSDEYRSLASGEFGDGPRGRLLFVVSTADLALSRGDLYVGLGLAKYLHRLGWGITLWPSERWDEPTPQGMDAAIVMIESFVPGLVHPDTAVIAWVRNWTDRWAELPYLGSFAQIWCSSSASAERMREVYAGPVEVVPIATDPELFQPVEVEREAGIVTTANFWGADRELIQALASLTSERITWFGANAQYLDLPAHIDHRQAIDYFRLPEVYSGWQIVIDDVIEPAARYGNQNSRLFDALACGAVVVTNCRAGLEELGLGRVPAYDSPTALAATIRSLRGRSAKPAALAEELRAIVLERHTWHHRAEAVSILLERRTAASESVTPLLVWATHLREELRRSDNQLAEIETVHADRTRRLHLATRRIQVLEAELDAVWSRRLRRYARYALNPRQAWRRLREGRS